MSASLVNASLSAATFFAPAVSTVIALNFTARVGNLIVVPMRFNDRFTGLQVANFAAPGWNVYTTTDGFHYILTKVSVGGETTVTVTYTAAQISYSSKQMEFYNVEKVPASLREVTTPSAAAVYTRSIDACVGMIVGLTGATSWSSAQDVGTGGGLAGDFDNPILTAEVTTFPGTMLLFGLGLPLGDVDDVHPSMASRV